MKGVRHVDGDGGTLDDDILPVVGEVGFGDGEVGGENGGGRRVES